ncbi:MAG TPA: bacteriohopanetetrol glucosamine biosynthesis glycosyltransferase HpnI [Candidatus Acidoferrum sp.]|nr:bacteriohopanetetrol glucosamine biosynthesis glycosyltransferase HpnI [Candidatus Acidoferrum sp.]
MILHNGLWREVLLLVAAAPLVYYLLAILAAFRFFGRSQTQSREDNPPSASLLKPVRGVDFGSYENFASFCKQDYPEYEILFAVNDEDDPAVPLIRKIMAEFPQKRIRLFTSAEELGANRKVNKLAMLAREAQYDLLVLTDGDVRVDPGYLREVVAPLRNKKIGAVTSFYRAIAQDHLAAKLEAIGAASDFFAGVLMARWKEGIRFALGASIATTKQWVQKMGGFETIVDALADDYELALRIASAGGEIVLSHEPVWTMYPAETFRGFWDHQLRWARTVRLCRPFSYLGLLFTQGLPWTLLAILLAPASWIAGAYLAAYLVLRFAMAWTVGVWGLRDEVLRRNFWLVPVRDAIYFVVWLASFWSNRIRWGSIEYAIQKGRMVPMTSHEKSAL